MLGRTVTLVNCVRLGRSLLCKQNLENSILKSSRQLHITCVCQKFHESDPKAEYRQDKWREEMKQKQWQIQKENLFGLRDGFANLRGEIYKWQKEVHKKFTDDSHLHVWPGDQEKIFQFNTKEAIDDWLVLSDSDHDQGYSSCKFELSPTGHGMFHGYINTTPPKDGRIKKAGYCSIRCPRKQKSFYRDDYYDWSSYTHFIMRCRGDGRTYLINLSTAGYFDITWNDIHHYTLYTRGGPYWQWVKIPFSKFLFANKGRVQDKQAPIPLYQIASCGISTGKVDGPFCLEIDYIGIEFDRHHTEKFAYEMYQMPVGVAGV